MVYDATVVFCRRFYAQDRRMTDQMVQAARSGVRSIMLCAVNQAAYLLERQLESQGETFVESGGFTEKLYGARSQARRSDRSDGSGPSDRSEQPRCPKCGQPMLRRTARTGPRAGQAFWGCSGYPACKGTLLAETTHRADPPHRADTNPRNP